MTIKELLEQLVSEVSRKMEPQSVHEYYRLTELVGEYSDVCTAVQSRSGCFDLAVDGHPQYLWVMTDDAPSMTERFLLGRIGSITVLPPNDC